MTFQSRRWRIFSAAATGRPDATTDGPTANAGRIEAAAGPTRRASSALLGAAERSSSASPGVSVQTRRSGAGADVGTLPQRYLRHRDSLEDRRQHIVGGHIVGESLERQDEAMAHHFASHVEYVLRQRVIPAANEGQGAGRENEVDRGSGAGAVGNVSGQIRHAMGLRRAGRGGQTD